MQRQLLLESFFVIETHVLCKFHKQGPKLECHIGEKEEIETCRDRLQYQWVRSVLLGKTYSTTSSSQFSCKFCHMILPQEAFIWNKAKEFYTAGLLTETNTNFGNVTVSKIEI